MADLNKVFDFLEGFVIGTDRVRNNWYVEHTTYPPYNLKKINTDKYQLEIAVAGIDPKNITIEVQEPNLIISAIPEKSLSSQEETYLVRGLAKRGFKRIFNLDAHMEVISSTVKNGILILDIHRKVPEQQKTKKIPITVE